MHGPTPDSLTAPFKDRRTGLTVFGVFTVLLGGLCALLVPLMLFGQQMTAQTTGVPADYRAIVPAVAIYGVLAVALVWLGIGSIMARRWARALLLIFSWTWLLLGLTTFGAMAVLLPQLMEAIQPPGMAGQPPLPEAAKWMMGVMMLSVVSIMFIALPGAWILFYRSPHVKATCEAHDPVPRWTDTCPPQVLALSIWTALSVPMMLVMPVAYHGVFLWFGSFISGVPGSAAWLLLAGLWAYAAWELHHLRLSGWWVLLLSTLVLLASNALTFARHDPLELYRRMGYAEAQLEQMRRFNFLGPSGMVWWSLVFGLLIVAYMLYVKRFFRAAGSAGAEP